VKGSMGEEGKGRESVCGESGRGQVRIEKGSREKVGRRILRLGASRPETICSYEPLSCGPRVGSTCGVEGVRSTGWGVIEAADSPTSRRRGAA